MTISPRFAGALAAGMLVFTWFMPAALADGSAVTGRDTLALRLKFAEARGLASAGRWADALERFEEIGRARSTPQVTFHLAMCNEQLGRLQEAARLYRKAWEAAQGSDEGVMSEALSRLRALEARMPRIVVHLEGAPEGVTLRVDEARVSATEPVRVDPGPHLVVALRDGAPVAAMALSALEWQTRQVRLRIYPAEGRPQTAGQGDATARVQGAAGHAQATARTQQEAREEQGPRRGRAQSQVAGARVSAR
ncbi:hypothetical protein [Chondromyces crocatus]|uniref:PEGA domain-containing protein n=1 Tax=Chondromyces crocatus TaxID=52 RepID=A0A0K1EA58_CHOCO|nr:hypothetical protein [Chondromyces crocatus]AKT37734.1 uncharacterized protein CMC5_018760 [Chondromyces crocatus]